ncbi:dihydrofolate reductase [Azorhizobium oxalatiphilum]|nr:dihydrofolate reductase [Azorhizobium oxalatiphilum]
MRPLSQIVAVAENGVIGRDQTLPWHLPSDLKRFRALTIGKPVLMGRHTYVSIGKPLPGRISVVVSTDPAFAPPPEVRVAPTLDEALRLADAAAEEMGADEIMVIGGRRIFAETEPLAALVHLTQVHASPEGDVRLPAFDPKIWRERDREGPLQGEKDDFPFSYVTLERI